MYVVPLIIRLLPIKRIVSLLLPLTHFPLGVSPRQLSCFCFHHQLDKCFTAHRDDDHYDDDDDDDDNDLGTVPIVVRL